MFVLSSRLWDLVFIVSDLLFLHSVSFAFTVAWALKPYNLLTRQPSASTTIRYPDQLSVRLATCPSQCLSVSQSVSSSVKLSDRQALRITRQLPIEPKVGAIRRNPQRDRDCQTN